MSINRKRGSIALARQLCYEIAGATSEDDDISGSDYGSVDVAEILSAEIERLRKVLAQLEQEPVACRFCHDKRGCWTWQCYSCGEIDDVQQPTAAQPEQEPSQWREMVVVSLVREGINKHRARGLADHFAAQPEQRP